MQMRARKKFQQTLNTLLVKHLFHRHFDNMPLPRKLININILINACRSTTDHPHHFPAASNQSPVRLLHSEKTSNSCSDPHASKLENRNARCAPSGKAGQPITKPLFCRHFDWLARSFQLGRLGQPIELQTGSRTTNGVGRANFKIGPLSTLNSRTSPKANFEICTPDPNSNACPPKNTPPQ